MNRKNIIKKNIIFLSLVALFLVIPQREVHAVKFYGTGRQYGYGTRTGNTFVVSGGGDPRCNGEHVGCNPTKKMRGTGDIAYCGNRNKDLSGGDYYLDTTWSNAKTCVYKVNDVKYSDGDCSSIVGYIIKEANMKKKGTVAKYAFTQVVLWTYLGQYTPSKYSRYNAYSNNYWKNHKQIRQVIEKGWSDYVKARDSGLVMGNTDGGNVDFQVSVDKNSFYYEPSGTSTCGGSTGEYKTKVITVKNNDTNSSQITLNISAIVNKSRGTKDEVNICSSSTRCFGSTLTVTLLKGQSVQYYLKAKSTATFNDVTFSVHSEYSKQVRSQSSEKVYDSERYTHGRNGKLSGAQSMIILKSSPANTVTNVEYSSEKSINFVRPSMQHYTCSGSNSSNSSNSYTKTSPAKKVCKSDATNQSNKEEYEYSFSGCNCTTLSLSNGNSVNLILEEKLSFSYQSLAPTKIYAGRGFEITNLFYQNKIKWHYADELGGVPYYYNSSDPFNFDATKVENEIISQLKDKLQNDSINIKFVSKNSNSYLNGVDEEFVSKLSLSSTYNSDKKVFEFDSNDFQLPDAYFSKDGKVKYGKSDNDYNIFGGNKRYVPLNYKENKYPLNIGYSNNGVNFSLIGNSAYAHYECNELIDYPGDTPNDQPSSSPVLGVTYRSISINTPFPKVTSLNWKDWYGVTSNKNRLANSFDNNNLLYKIELNSSNLAQISANASSYSSWNSIDKNGSSSFITGNSFSSRANSNSYCAIGKFSSTCDR
mgnify:CR=1 FL=1